MKITIQTKKGKELSKKEEDFMNSWRKKEFGEKEPKEFKKDYSLNTEYFFVIEEGKIMAFGLLVPVRINYLGKNYNILGIGNIVSIKKKRNYGRILMSCIISYLRRKEKTGVGFCERKNIGFYEKVGLKTKKDLMKRFKYKHATKEERESESEGVVIYYNGKDGFMNKVLSTKSEVTIPIPHW
jgi:hypothetical protein